MHKMIEERLIKKITKRKSRELIEEKDCLKEKEKIQCNGIKNSYGIDNNT